MKTTLTKETLGTNMHKSRSLALALALSLSLSCSALLTFGLQIMSMEMCWKSSKGIIEHIFLRTFLGIVF
jgi:hypothetical protein